MQSDNNLTKRFIDYISHLGIILVLLIGFPFENCLGNYSIPPKDELAINEREPARTTYKNQKSDVVLDNGPGTLSSDLDTNSSVKQEIPKLIIHPNPAVQDPAFSRIPSYVSSTSSDSLPTVLNNQRSSNEISGDLTKIISLTSNKKQVPKLIVLLKKDNLYKSGR